MHAYLRTYIDTCIHAYIHANIHKHRQTDRHTDRHTYTHTHTHTDMNTDRQSDRHACIHAGDVTIMASMTSASIYACMYVRIHAGDVTIMASMTSAVAESKAHFGKDAWGLGVPANLSARVYVHEYMYIFVCARECSREAAATRSPRVML